MKIRLAALNARYSHSCPALFYVRQELRRHLPGATVELCQFTINDPFYQTLLRLADGAPQALFFSCYVWNAEMVARLAVDLHRLLPAVALVFGGPQAPHLALPDQLPRTVVHGPVEGVAKDFYRHLARGCLQPAYHGDFQAPFAQPYRGGDFSEQLAHRHLYYESSRGCPFACSYCLSAGGGMRALPLAQVEAELSFLLGFGVPSLRFVDRTFNAVPERALAIWRRLLARPGETVFHFEIAPDRLSEEMFAFLATVAPGRFRFEVGLQTLNRRSLAAVNRRLEPEAAEEQIQRLTSLGNIHVHLDLILGLPYEDRASYADTFRRAFALAPQELQMGLLKVLPATPLAGRRREFGLLASETPPYPLLANRWLSQEELAGLFWFGQGVEKFYNNRWFRSLWRYLRQTGEDVFAFFESLLALGREQGLFRRAATQEFLASLVAALAASRPDRELLLEVLRFDWLGCGHRHWPPFLGADRLKACRDTLWQRLPAELPPLYRRGSRKEFFKRSTFCRFSREALLAAGLEPGGESGLVAFVPGRRQGRVRPHLLAWPKPGSPSSGES